MSNLPLDFMPDARASKVFGDLKKSLGRVPNIYKLMGNSSIVLEAYLNFSNALGKGSLSEQDRQHIALAVAGYDKCVYCASAHTLMAKNAGVSIEETQQNLHGNSKDSRINSLIMFCLAIVNNKGNVSDADIDMIRKADFNDAQIVEIIANVCANIFTNYFNHVARTDLDFPEVKVD